MRRSMGTDFIAAIAVAIVTVSFSAATSHAAEVTLRSFNASTGALLATCGPFASATLTVALPASCGQFLITKQSGGIAAQVAALPGDTENQLVVRTTVIKNAGASRARLQIDGTHTFILPSGISVKQDRAYGVGLSASFSRLGGLVLASGDTIQKKGFYAYFVGGNIFEDQIGGGVGSTVGNLSYVVPSSGSTTQNTIPNPAPAASESFPRKCIDLVPNNNCTDDRERLRTLVDVTLAPNDIVVIPNGAHDIAATTFGQVQATLNTLTAQLLVQQNTPVVTINPFDNGFLGLLLVCNPQFPCEDVVPTSLSFGPNGAAAVSTKLSDSDKDGDLDLFIKVRQPDTGIGCDDTAATLSGTILFNGVPYPFHATAGFGINSSSCP